MPESALLSMTGICKSFPGVRALDQVQLRVRKGSVHALMGENGAGKSTLMKCLIGMDPPDAGTIAFKGESVQIPSPHAALRLGISMIHQELNPIPQMTIAENIFLGRETRTWYGLVDLDDLNRRAQELLDRLAIRLGPRTKMHRLSIAHTQLIEIAKAVSYDADLIIMDEPTSALTEAETAVLFETIAALKDEGHAIIYITHKMDEVFTITDEVTVLRDGKYIGSDQTAAMTRELLIRRMVGRELTDMFHKEPAPIGETVLEVKGLTGPKFRDVSFEVKKGEIFGVAGLMGAGRTELLEAVFGVTRPESGEVRVHGSRIEIRSPADAIRAGLALLTEDRKLTGLFLNASVRDNMIIANIDHYLRGLLINPARIAADCEQMRDQLRIKTPELSQLIKNLSGGNQQKVLISRWLLTGPDILILDEPTRGIDVGAKAEIHRLMSELTRQGKTIVMISSELPEILGMSDRIMVMHEGDKIGELGRGEATQEKIMHLATGAGLSAA